jgi:hypothetical protein
MALDLDVDYGETTREWLMRCVAKAYSKHLSERLALMPELVMPVPPADEDCTTKHLLWMAGQVMDNAHNHEKWSVTKLHRWIGYIQGVMTMRKLTDVQQERDDYRRIKQETLTKLKQSTDIDI